MRVLRRHQLAYLTDAAWGALQARPWDEVARACLAHWAANRLPLVVTRQNVDLPDDVMALGLPAPLQWQLRKFALQVPRAQVQYFGDFPVARDVAGLLPQSTRPDWIGLCATLEHLGCSARVYGSHGWQQLTDLAYLHGASDIDLCLSVSGPAMADAVAAALYNAVFGAPRLDGELVFPDGAAVAWREWLQWRACKVHRILVKRLSGAALETGDDRLHAGVCLPC
jgi:phosphoribosyl-dephospho-CoA transferase